MGSIQNELSSLAEVSLYQLYVSDKAAPLWRMSFVTGGGNLDLYLKKIFVLPTYPIYRLDESVCLHALVSCNMRNVNPQALCAVLNKLYKIRINSHEFEIYISLYLTKLFVECKCRFHGWTECSRLAYKCAFQHCEKRKGEKKGKIERALFLSNAELYLRILFVPRSKRFLRRKGSSCWKEKRQAYIWSCLKSLFLRDIVTRACQFLFLR